MRAGTELVDRLEQRLCQLQHTREVARTPLLVGSELFFVREREPYVVEAVQEPVAGMVVDLEFFLDAGSGDGAFFEVNGDLGFGVMPDGFEEPLYRRLR